MVPIHHGVFVVRVICQSLKPFLPHTFLAPTRVHRFKLSKALSADPATEFPQDSDIKQPPQSGDCPWLYPPTSPSFPGNTSLILSHSSSRTA